MQQRLKLAPQLARIARTWFQGFRPPPKLTVSQWADANRKLSSEASAEPGQWRTDRAAYQREIMDSGKPITVVMSSAQVGKTEIVNNVVAFHVDQDPSPILVLQPTLDMAETWSKDRLAPMVRDTPALKNKIAEAHSRNSGNTILHKKFVGGHLTIVGANSASGLASRPVRFLAADEVDRYPPSAGTEGDPLNLAIKRTTTFWNRRILIVSTPTTAGLSRIEAEWNRSDKRRYHVPCPHCEEHQVLKWGQIRWPENRPDEAAYHCEHCGAEWTEGQRLAAVRAGKWIAEEPDAPIAGFHLNEIYSPWSNCASIVRSFLASRKSYETRKTWVNTCLGEPFEEAAAKLDASELMQRGEDWSAGVPNEVLVVTCGVDVQADRLEVERVGWGLDEESYSLDHYVIWGDPADPNTWKRLDAYLLQPTFREDGRELPVRTTCIDSGGHHTQIVYKFCKLRRNRRVFAVKGRAEANSIWPSKIRAKGKDKSDVTIVGVDIAKDAIYSHLRVDKPGPGFCHFPAGRAKQWFDQLTAEKVKTTYSKGFPRRVYILPEGARNEGLDCRVYAYAALISLNVRWGTEAEASASSPEAARRVRPAPARVAPELAALAVSSQRRGSATPSRKNSGFLQRKGGRWL